MVLQLQAFIKQHFMVSKSSSSSSSRRTTGSGRKSTTGSTAKKWSGRVTRESNALDLNNKVFTLKDPKKIARSLKRSAERSMRRKGTAFQSAMSMLSFYINRAGRHLSAAQKRPLQKAKNELRALYGKDKQ